MPYDLPRIPLPTDASSAELSRLPVAIRQQALFSARLNTLGPLAQIGSDIHGILSGTRDESEARRDIRAALRAAGYQPPAGTEGGLLDHTSKTRLDLIINQNVRAARGYGKWAADMDPVSLDLWPAQELIRIMARRNPRGDWKRRWTEAGGRLYGGRMIALKTDPVWINLNRFGVPYPPYDYGSGMGVMDIDRDQAVKLGLIGETDELTPEPVPFPETTEFSLPDLAAMPDLQASILKVFGAKASITDGVLSFPSTVLVEGAIGTAKSLGLTSPDVKTVTSPPAPVRRSEADKYLAEGAVAKDKSGVLQRFTPDIPAHWKDKDPADIDKRMSRIREAFAAIQEPQEQWERKGRQYYMKTFIGENGLARRMVVICKDGVVETWIPSDGRGKGISPYRKGTLRVSEGA